MVGNSKIINSMHMSPWPYLFSYEFSLQSEAIPWNTMMVNKEFSKSMPGTFGRSIVFKENSYPVLAFILIRTKCCLFHVGSGPM